MSIGASLELAPVAPRTTRSCLRVPHLGGLGTGGAAGRNECVGGRPGVLAAQRISPATLRWMVAAWGVGVPIALEVSRHVS